MQPAPRVWATLAIGLAPASLFVVALAAMCLAGFMNPIANGPLHAIFQAAVAPEVQGRVFMVIGSLCSAMWPLGMAIAGPLADAIGVRAWFIMGGVACVLMGAGAFFVPAIMHLEDQATPSVRVEATPTPEKVEHAAEIAA